MSDPWDVPGRVERWSLIDTSPPVRMPSSLITAGATGGETKPDVLPLLLALVVLVAVALLWHRSSARWVDGLLITGLLGTIGLPAFVMLG